MSYQTLEVEVDNGRIASRGGEILPAKAHGLLTILGPLPAVSAPADTVSLADLARDLAGIGRGEYTDLSTNKAHLQDFGR